MFESPRLSSLDTLSVWVCDKLGFRIPIFLLVIAQRGRFSSYPWSRFLGEGQGPVSQGILNMPGNHVAPADPCFRPVSVKAKESLDLEDVRLLYPRRPVGLAIRFRRLCPQQLHRVALLDDDVIFPGVLFASSYVVASHKPNH